MFTPPSTAEMLAVKSGGVPAPALPLFGPFSAIGINTGWNLDPIPEPTAAMLLAIGAALVVLRRLRRR